MVNEIWAEGWDKYHKYCTGRVRFVENVSKSGHSWDLECLKCGQILYEEDVTFVQTK